MKGDIVASASGAGAPKIPQRDCSAVEINAA